MARTWRNLPTLPLFISLVAPLLAQDPVQLFPKGAYAGLGQPWLTSVDEGRLFSAAFQARKTRAFRQQFLSPWDPEAVAKLVTPEILDLEERVLANLRQGVAKGALFGPNFHPYGQKWLKRLASRLPVPAEGPWVFRKRQRAVAVDNAAVRLLPTEDPAYQSHTLPGQGYPFDELQNSVLWAGTPVYVLGESRDRAWLKVLVPGFAGWVRSQSLALVENRFERTWRRAVARQGLTAVIATATPVVDQGGTFRFHAYVGSVFPQGPRRSILVPGRNAGSRRAVCGQAYLQEGCGVPQPWPYTPAKAAQLWKALVGRPYGWGNLSFNNDCSSELKSFFTPFGLWLPRHSAAQREVGPATDLSDLGLAERLEAVNRIARPYRSLVWIEGHIMLYLGPVTHADAKGFMTYQNLWGLRPRAFPDYRSIVGRSALFPVLDVHPEAPALDPLANKRRLVITQLDADWTGVRPRQGPGQGP